MENNNSDRLAEAGKRVRAKVEGAQNTKSANPAFDESSFGVETVRRNDGSVRYSSAVDEDESPRRRASKNTRKRRKKNRAVIALVLFFAAVVALSVFLIVRNTRNDEAAAAESQTEPAFNEIEAESVPDVTQTEPPETEPAVVETDGTKYVSVRSDLIHSGNLILVNYKYEYLFPAEDVLVQMKPKAEHFSVSALDTPLQEEALDSFVSLTNDLYENTGFDGILVVSSFRDKVKQQEIYNDRLERYGSEYAAAYVADPGFSEHHTGLAMDLSVYVGGVSYDIETYPACEWFNDNYDRYGYILRYPEHKAGITSINYEGWHYRYVGLPHSLIMDQLDLCLEEYTDYIRGYTFGAALCYDRNMGTVKTVDCTTYTAAPSESVIYFVPVSEGDTTDIPLFSDSYSLSGNNVDGFVVTVN